MPCYLVGAHLNDADLSDAYLSGVNLTGADLVGVNLFGTNLVDANLTGATRPNGFHQSDQPDHDLCVSPAIEEPATDAPGGETADVASCALL